MLLHSKSLPIQVDDIVLVETNESREHWALAKVINILPDSYGIVRAVEVLINNSLHMKILNKLVPLEVNTQNVAVGRAEALPPVVNYSDPETPDQASNHDQSSDTQPSAGAQVTLPEISKKGPQAADLLHANRIVPQSS